jgi:FAD synthase
LLDITDKDYYDQEVSCTILKFHRPTKKFDSVAELRIAMKEDEATGRAWFKTRQLLS